jgi:hypothetical protein
MKLLILMFALAAIHDESAQKKARIAAALAEQDQRMPCATTHITNSFISNFIDIDGEPYALYCKGNSWVVDEVKTKAIQSADGEGKEPLKSNDPYRIQPHKGHWEWRAKPYLMSQTESEPPGWYWIQPDDCAGYDTMIGDWAYDDRGCIIPGESSCWDNKTSKPLPNCRYDPPIPKPIKWRLSTSEEIRQRELKGWGCDNCVGDPPCTLGSTSGSADYSVREIDCGLTDGQGNFEKLVVVQLTRIEKTKTKPYFRTHVWKRCQMSQEQYYSLASGPYHDIKIDDVVEQCRQNKLPKWPAGQ